jgi:hypothetical protein
MKSTKIISIILFILVILISTFFSVYMESNKEGLTSMYFNVDKKNNYFKANLSKYEVSKILEILNAKEYDNITKIKKIYDTYRNNDILLNMYNSIGYNCIDSVKKYIIDGSNLNSNGELIDENVITKKNTEYIQAVLSGKKNNFEKTIEIKEYICKDQSSCDERLSNLYKNYENILLEVITNYVNTLNVSNNADVANKFGAI